MRHFIQMLGALIGTLFTCQIHAQPPNILFIVSEDNGPALGCYGAPVSSPHLDRLAEEGVRFANAYVPQAGCSPSRAAFLTGLYPHQNGQIGLATWKYHMYEHSQPQNLVNHLKQAGYRTGIIGKLHINPTSAFAFDVAEIPGSNFARKDQQRYIDHARDFFEASEQPFYLQVNFPDAHRPFTAQVDGMPDSLIQPGEVPPLPYIGLDNARLREETANYYNCMMRLDHLVGQLLEGLRASGKYDNTFIVYIGDHGADIIRGKRTCYEGGLRIPMIISYQAGGVLSKAVAKNLVNTIDLYPTFLDLIGANIPKQLPGKSLMPILQGTGEFERTYLFAQYHVHSNHNPYPQRAVRDKRYKLIHNLVFEEENPGYQFTINHFKFEGMEELIQSAEADIRTAYARMKHPPEFELYDLKKDPHEWNNLAEDRRYRKKLRRLQQALQDWQINTSDPLIDKAVAERLFQDIVNTNIQRIEIPYEAYMNPSQSKRIKK
ncbi:MAG: sulfatase [Bacteroidota bacterium]